MKINKNILLVLLVLAIGSVGQTFDANDVVTAMPPGIKWGVGRLVFAQWEKGQTYPPYQVVVDSQGKIQSKEPDQWGIRIDDEVEIGLRDDGVIVWRKALK